MVNKRGCAHGTSPIFLKKMRKTLIIMIIVSLTMLIAACRNKGSGVEKRQSGIETTIIQLDPKKISEISMDSLIDTVWYVPLETKGNSIVGKIDKLIFSNDRIFISDSEITHSILCFDLSGQFLFRIQERGRGPNQYLTLTSFDVDSEREEVIVYDAQQRAFMKYDFSGKLVSKHPLGFLFDDFRLLSGSRFIAYTQYIPNPELNNNSNSTVFIFDYRNKKTAESLLIFDETLSLFNKIHGLINYISSSNLAHYFYDYYSNAIYSFNGGQFLRVWDIDFESKNIPKSFWPEANFSSHAEGIRNGEFCGGLINFQVLEDWIIGLYSCQSKSNVFLFNKKQSASYLLNEKIATTPFGFPIFMVPPFHSTGAEIVTVIEPSWFAKLLAAGLPEGILPQHLSHSEVNSNPILQIIRLK